jgi:outer membrane protein assembly factor BamB
MDSNPAVVGKRGFIGAEDDHIYCFDPLTGRILWHSVKTDGSVESSVCVAKNKVIAGSDYGILYCCDAGSGKLLWTARTLGDTDSTAVHSGGRLFVGSKTGKTGESGHLWCLNLANGKTVWHLSFPRGFWSTPALNPARKRLYIGCNSGVVYCLRMGDGGLVWKRNLGDRIWSSAAVYSGKLVIGVRNGRLWCLDEATGKPLWMFNDGFDIDATPCVAEGLIVFGSQNGWVYCIGEAPRGEKLNTHWFADRFPVTKPPDRNPVGVRTVANPAPEPKAYDDTSSHVTTNLLRPVYGPACVKPSEQPPHRPTLQGGARTGREGGETRPNTKPRETASSTR